MMNYNDFWTRVLRRIAAGYSPNQAYCEYTYVEGDSPTSNWSPMLESPLGTPVQRLYRCSNPEPSRREIRRRRRLFQWKSRRVEPAYPAEMIPLRSWAWYRLTEQPWVAGRLVRLRVWYLIAEQPWRAGRPARRMVRFVQRNRPVMAKFPRK